MGPAFTEILLKRISDSNAFQTFIDSKVDTSHWIISADFCFDKGSFNRTMAITLYAIDDLLEEQIKKIKTHITKDIKNVSTVSDDAIIFLNDADHFSFVYVLQDTEKVFSGSNSENTWGSALEYVSKMADLILDKSSRQDLIKQFKKLKEQFKRKTPNNKLLMDLIIFSSACASIAAFLARKGQAKNIVLLPDRDCITDWCDSIYAEFIQIYVQGALVNEDIQSYEITRGEPDVSGNNWYDDFIRTPDYLAGALARLNIHDSTTRGGKHVKIISGALSHSLNKDFYLISYGSFFKIQKIYIENSESE